jgi:hypothetical protein
MYRKTLQAIFAFVAVAGAQQIDWISQVRNKPFLSASDYNFPAQRPAVNLSAHGVNQSIPLSPCPLGVNGSDTAHYLYIADSPNSEAVLITGGTCTSGALSGTITVTPNNGHSGNSSWTIASATNGQQEAVVVTPGGGQVLLPPQALTDYATVTHGAYHQFLGQGSGATLVSCLPLGASPCYAYQSAIQSMAYDVDSSIAYSNFTIYAQSPIALNSLTPPGGSNYQGNLKGVKIQDMNLQGTYATATDVNRWTNVVPSAATVQAFGVGFSCGQCFRAWISHNLIENFGIGIYYDGDEAAIENENRIDLDGWLIYIDGTPLSSIWSGNQNVIAGNKLAAIERMGGVVLNGALSTRVLNNYFESYCPSSVMVKSTAGYNLQIAGNRIDDPNNSSLCATGAANSTPFINLDDKYNEEITGNSMQIGQNIPPPMAFGTTYASYSTQDLYSIHDNGTTWPNPTGFATQLDGLGPVVYPVQPLAVVGAVKPYLWSANNSGGGYDSYAGNPWVADGVTGRYVLSQTLGDINAYFYLQTSEITGFSVNVTARYDGVHSSTFLQVQYQGSSLVTLYANNLTFSNASEVQTQTAYATIPNGQPLNGYFIVTVNAGQAYIESVEMAPQRILPTGGVVASASTITPSGLAFPLSGTAAISTINLPSLSFAGQVCAIPTGIWTTATGGNIALASTAIVGRQLCWTYLPGQSLWYPSY